MSQYLPPLRWLRSYRRTDLRADLIAGITTAVMLIPQGMAYAMLAGLPPITGLYASIVPLAVYGLLGTSRELAVGPVAMVSLLVATGVGALTDDPSTFLAYAIVLAGMVGVLQLGMGILRAGFLVNFLSHPVISGFSSAAALIIGFSQVKHLLGVDLPRSHHIHVIVAQAWEQLDMVHGPTLAIGLVGVALLVLLKRFSPMFPRALFVVAAGTLWVWFSGLADESVAIVGSVPAGLPSLRVPEIDLGALRALWPTAVTIALVAFMESISVAKNFAGRSGYEVEPNQELIALGAANIAGSLFGAYPVTGGFSRTAVNAQAGSKSGMASIVTAAVVAVTLLLLTPLFHYLPKAILAAIIMAAVFSLVDVREVIHLWRVKRSDLILLCLTFLSTLALGIEQGIVIGVVASLLWFVVRTTRPHSAVLGRLPGAHVYRNVERFPQAEVFAGVLILRIDAQFYFGNVTFLKDTLRQLEASASGALRAVVLEAASINNLDSSADSALAKIVEDYQRRGIALHLASVKGPVLDVMHRSGLYQKIGTENFHEDLDAAVTAANAHGTAQRPGPSPALENPIEFSKTLDATARATT